MGQVRFDPARGVDKGFGIAVVFGNARRHGQHVGVENNVFRRKSVVGQQFVGSRRHFRLSFEGVGLSPLVEEHHHGGRTEAVNLPGPAQELRFALFERDGVDDGFALRHFEPGREHLPFRRVDHHRHAGDLGFRGHQVEERAHRRGAVDQPVVHADVDDLRPGVDLRPGHRKGLLVISLADQPGEFGRPGDVRALADVDEVGFGDDSQRLQTAQHCRMAGFGKGPRGVLPGDLRQFENVCGGGAAASAHDVDHSAPQVLADIRGEHFGRLVVAAHHVGKPGVGVCRNACFGRCRQPFEVGQELPGSVGAVETYGQQVCMRHRGGECLDGLSREGAAAGVGERSRNHHGNRAAQFRAERVDGVEGRLGVERVEDRFDQQDVRAAVHEAPRLVRIGFGQLREGHFAGRGIRHVGRHRGRAVRGTHRARHEAGFLRVAGREFIRRTAGRFGRGFRHFISQPLHAVVGQRHGIGVERVGLDDVGSRLQVFFVDFAHYIGARQHEQVVAPFQLHRPVAEAFAAVILLLQSVALDHCPEAAVEQQNAFFQLFV